MGEDRNKKREVERDSSTSGSLSKRPEHRTGVGQNQEPGDPSGSPTWVAVAQAYGPSSTAFPGTLPGN